VRGGGRLTYLKKTIGHFVLGTPIKRERREERKTKDQKRKKRKERIKRERKTTKIKV
jgi:hypothetical protein